MKFCTLLFKHMLSHIVKRNYACAPMIYFYRLISPNKVDFAKSSWFLFLAIPGKNWFSAWSRQTPLYSVKFRIFSEYFVCGMTNIRNQLFAIPDVSKIRNQTLKFLFQVIVDRNFIILTAAPKNTFLCRILSKYTN